MDAVAAHPRGLTAWHGLCVVGMLVMLVVAVPPWFGLGGLAVFTVGAASATAGVVRGWHREAYARLGLCCLAMMVMLVPRGPVPGSTAPPMARMPGMSGMGGFAAVMALVMLAVAALCVRRLLRGGLPGRSRSGAAGEAVLAVAMAGMLAGLV